MKMNFFDWIREGVRQSVLLGLSDAAGEIGSDKEVEVLQQQLLTSLQQGRIADDSPRAGVAAAGPWADRSARSSRPTRRDRPAVRRPRLRTSPCRARSCGCGLNDRRGGRRARVNRKSPAHLLEWTAR